MYIYFWILCLPIQTQWAKKDILLRSHSMHPLLVLSCLIPFKELKCFSIRVFRMSGFYFRATPVREQPCLLCEFLVIWCTLCHLGRWNLIFLSLYFNPIKDSSAGIGEIFIHCFLVLLGLLCSLDAAVWNGYFLVSTYVIQQTGKYKNICRFTAKTSLLNYYLSKQLVVFSSLKVDLEKQKMNPL